MPLSPSTGRTAPAGRVSARSASELIAAPPRSTPTHSDTVAHDTRGDLAADAPTRDAPRPGTSGRSLRDEQGAAEVGARHRTSWSRRKLTSARSVGRRASVSTCAYGPGGLRPGCSRRCRRRCIDVVVGHETLSRCRPGSVAATRQVCTPAGWAETRTRPAASTATHSDLDGHEIAFNLRPPPISLVPHPGDRPRDGSMPRSGPPSSIATHSDRDGQDDPGEVVRAHPARRSPASRRSRLRSGEWTAERRSPSRWRRSRGGAGDRREPVDNLVRGPGAGAAGGTARGEDVADIVDRHAETA